MQADVMGDNCKDMKFHGIEDIHSLELILLRSLARYSENSVSVMNASCHGDTKSLGKILILKGYSPNGDVLEKLNNSSSMS